MRLLRERMAELTSTEASDWYCVFKARQAMQVAFGALGEATGRSVVVTQPFTCVTAIDPILSAGLAVRYGDVSRDTLALDVEQLDLSEEPAAVVLQHTFGIMSPEADAALVEAAHAAGALVVEDCAHCVGRMARGGDGTPLADVSVHSFGVEKMLAGVYFGSAMWVSPSLEARVRERIVGALEALPALDKARARAAERYRNQIRVLTRLPKGVSVALRSRWEKSGAFEPAVADMERRGRVKGTPALPSAWVCTQATAALAGIAENERGRRECVRAYLDAFGDDGTRLLGVPRSVTQGEVQPLLRMPVFMPDTQKADAALAACGRLGFYGQPWPRPLLLPGVIDEGAYGCEGGFACPVSERLSECVAALPTDIEPDGAVEVAKACLELARGGI